MTRSTNNARTRAILEKVFAERLRQEARYGEANEILVDGTGPHTRWLLPYTNQSALEVQETLRLDYQDFEEETGAPTWVHLVREEVAEAFQENDPARLAEELIQVAALCVSWVERLPVEAHHACPHCNGEGQVDVNVGTADATDMLPPIPCAACRGLGIR